VSVTLDIPAHEAHVLRVFAVMDAGLSDEEVIAALGARVLRRWSFSPDWPCWWRW